ncbi:hypothetical protein [Pseudomonas frederiksbergensis]|uniref:Halovibrin HvnC n=1 Tax=Pseudomonas frederiksbergensis TaxID=104087 RepID=A0A423KKM9_9PSED|nr:hypothetical protein [Pseudomonas frederiksbergensis]RON53943.1 hypothetical protein BK665_13665 [Pseudomonas frederiksbergensis]
MRKLIVLFLIGLVTGCSHSSVEPLTVTSQATDAALSGQQIAAQLNTLYSRRSVNCNNSDTQPAYLCSGVTLRTTVKDPANKYKVWDPSPTSIASGGVSFSYLRADANFGRLAWGYGNGLIFYPKLETPAGKTAVDSMCSYPMDGWTWTRTSVCGAHASYPSQGGACQNTGVTTAEQWKEVWDSSSANQNIRQCSFDVRGERGAQSGPAFYQSLRAKSLLGAQGFAEHNEVVLKTWPSGRPNTLPLMAFFFVAGGTNAGLADAQYNQRDFYNSTNPQIVVPIVRLTPATSATGIASFSYVAADQVVGTMPLSENFDSVPVGPLVPGVTVETPSMFVSVLTNTLRTSFAQAPSGTTPGQMDGIVLRTRADAEVIRLVFKSSVSSFSFYLQPVSVSTSRPIQIKTFNENNVLMGTTPLAVASSPTPRYFQITAPQKIQSIEIHTGHTVVAHFDHFTFTP